MKILKMMVSISVSALISSPPRVGGGSGNNRGNSIKTLYQNVKKTILKTYQINFSKKNRNCIIEGRDISTQILPNSNVKFYFTCDLDLAAKRRHKELKKNNPSIKLSEVKKSLKLRNIRDKKRKHSPLLKHRDALEIHTGKLNKKKMIDKMSKHIEKVMNKKYVI